MEIIPAIDLRGGRCVRLFQGDFSKETVYSNDPVGVALRWQEEGARRIHVVDLDGTAYGELSNLPIIKEIARLVDVPVQVGGGIRSLHTAQKVLEADIERVVLGTAAVENPHLVEELCGELGGQRVVVAVDAQEGVVATNGWQKGTSITSLELLRQMAQIGVPRFLYTDISRDGTLTHPNFQATRLLVDTGLAILASGGISSLEHIRQLQQMGVEGIILGRALYTGDIQLREAIQAVKLPQ